MQTADQPRSEKVSELHLSNTTDGELMTRRGSSSSSRVTQSLARVGGEKKMTVVLLVLFDAITLI